MAGAPKGNKNGAKENRLWGDTLRRVIAQDKKDRVRAAIEKMLDLAADGESWACKELADRLDGKAIQQIAGIDGGPIVVETVRYADTNTE